MIWRLKFCYDFLHFRVSHFTLSHYIENSRTFNTFKFNCIEHVQQSQSYILLIRLILYKNAQNTEVPARNFVKAGSKSRTNTLSLAIPPPKDSIIS